MRRRRAMLYRLKVALELIRQVWERRHQFGWKGIAIRAFRRLAGAFQAKQPTDSARFLSAYPRPGRRAQFDVIYVVGFWQGTPKRYRVFNLVEALSAAGYAVHVMAFDQLDDIRRYRWRTSVIVLFRAEYDRLSGVDELIGYARKAGIRLVYDIDDLVFDPAIADEIDAVWRMRDFDRKITIEAMARRSQMMLACDFVTVSTASLARNVQRYGRRALVIPNSLNSEQLRVAAEIAAAPPSRRGEHIVIVYLSGSPTHQRDFAECEPALIETLQRHPHVRFRLVGYLDLGPEWERFRDRIERVDFLEAADLLRCIAESQINLAPLELDNLFCEAKSELKFFEAALVGVPTIASATETFTAAIENGVSGFVVRGKAEWLAALELCVTCEARRKAVGEAARIRALGAYTPAALTPSAIAALGLPPRSPGCGDDTCR
jgi:glycosyltransferase involved in cell wall biosynthesis